MANNFSISILTTDQLRALTERLLKEKPESIKRIYVFADLALGDAEVIKQCERIHQALPLTEWILSLPEVLRMQDYAYLRQCASFLEESTIFSGVLVGNLEGAGFFQDINEERVARQKNKFRIYGDHSLYLWNSLAIKTWDDILSGGCLPLELRDRDQLDLLKHSFSWEKITYGRIPMMVTANCIAKTTNNCLSGKQGKNDESILGLRDRMGIDFPVRRVCRHCYNVIYNSVPLSLHEEVLRYDASLLLRLQFTVENEEETSKILRYFLSDQFSQKKPPYQEFTKGREKKGAL